MRINIGSKNPAKIEASQEIVLEYDFLKGSEVVQMEVATGVPEQPKTLDETIQGAMHRALGAFKNCKYSVGLESGLFRVPYTKTGHMDICAAAIYDGSEYHIGLSQAFEFPRKVTKLIFEEGLNASEACLRTGLTEHNYIGHGEGIIGLLTKGRVNRKEQAKAALQMALIHLED